MLFNAKRILICVKRFLDVFMKNVMNISEKLIIYKREVTYSMYFYRKITAEKNIRERGRDFLQQMSVQSGFCRLIFM
jgi:hypothetical protein